MWKEINRYRISSGDGHFEDLILERNDEGNFRLKNDFGNINIEFDAMTGIEFARRMLDDIKDEVEFDLNNLFDDDDLMHDSDDDSDMDTASFKNLTGDCDGQLD